jgi:hypothetical protein
MSDRDTVTGALPAEVLQALLEQSLELLVVTDASGAITWANDRFVAMTGTRLDGAVRLHDVAADGEAGESARRHFDETLTGREPNRNGLRLRAASGPPLWVDVRARRLGPRMLWTFSDVSTTRFLATQARHQGELLDTAQEFGRLGLWQRRIPSGEGRWDRHVFRFWGLDPSARTPDYDAAVQRIHPDDRTSTYVDSTRRAGRYAQRYRVIQPDGTVRWIHSQWEVKNGPKGVPDRAIGIMMDDTGAYEAARQLGDVNAQLKLAVELGQIAIWRHDLRTHRMFYNDRAFELLQMKPRPDGLSIDEVRAYIHPDDIALVLASAKAALASNQPTDMEARYRRLDGSYRTVLTRRVVERDAAGTPVAFVGVALDVTERVEERRQAEELARRLDAASQAAGIGVWTTDDDPPRTDWNAQMFAIFDRFEPPTVPTFGEWLREAIHPDDRDRVARISHAYLKEPHEGHFELEFRIVRRDQGVRWVVMRANLDRASTHRRRALGVAIDVTEYRTAIDALRDASERASLIARHAGIGLWEAKIDGSGERWDEQMFHLRGLSPRQPVPSREDRLALVHPDDFDRVLDSRPGAGLGTLPAAYEFRIRLPNGGWRWLASRSALVFDDAGQPARRVGVNWDITETKQAELVRQQAALAEREVHAKSQFLSRMSHELRTPLNAVLGFTQLLQIEARQSHDEAQLAKLGHIRGAGDHLLSLINDVLDLSGIESGELKLSLGAVDLSTLLRESVPLVESLAAQHGVSIELGATEATAHADPRRLRQVLINLLSNAIKYNRRGGRVFVHARHDGDHAVLTVQDTGRGLSPAQQRSLFEPFNRFGAESEGIEGTGIGLTIVKALVEGMQGRVAVTSAPGQGTRFDVTLLRADAAMQPAAPAEADDSARAPWTESRRERAGQVLYIEDNPVNVLLVEELVRSVAGLAVASELSGAAGVARAKVLQPDLVLIDLQLPDFDGFEVLRRLRADPATRAIPCVALSANAMPEDIARGLSAGFADYWTKPIDFTVFLSALKKRFPAATPQSS